MVLEKEETLSSLEREGRERERRRDIENLRLRDILHAHFTDVFDVVAVEVKMAATFE